MDTDSNNGTSKTDNSNNSIKVYSITSSYGNKVVY